MKISGSQVTAARGLLKLTQAELAAAAGVAEITIFRFEAGQAEPQRANLDKIRSELQRRGIEFLNGDSPPRQGDGIGVRLNFDRAADFAKEGRNTAP